MSKGFSTFRIKGIDKVINELNAEMQKMQTSISTQGFIRVAIVLRRSMATNTPYIPIDTGNLRASWFTAIKGIAGKTTSQGVGFSAATKGKVLDKQKQAAVVATVRAVVESKKNPLMIFGFSANYAAAVHEEKRKVEWKVAGAGPKFFQKALEREKGNILKILAENGKL
jgi:hypothetical protein